MADVDGSWACTVNSPLGDQEFVLTVASAGDRFTGALSGAGSRQEIEDGAVDGDDLAWTMAIQKPMAITLACTARIVGDLLEGKVKAGIFGSFPLTGRRV